MRDDAIIFSVLKKIHFFTQDEKLNLESELKNSRLLNAELTSEMKTKENRLLAALEELDRSREKEKEFELKMQKLEERYVG